MKRTLFSFFAILMATFVYAGDGTKENPYTVAEVKSNCPTEGAINDVYVKGYIVGTAKSNSAFSEEPVISNLFIADSQTETDATNCVPVELKKGSNARTELNLVDHPDNLGKLVVLCGSVTQYFSVPGVKSVTEFSFSEDSTNPGDSGSGDDIGIESPYKTLTFSSETNNKPISSYTDTWTATIDGFTWNLSNFNNNKNGWEYVKCGSKNSESVATITTASAIDEAITKVVVTVDAVSSDYVKTTYLEVASDPEFTSTQTIEVKTLAKGKNTYTITAPSANQYYRLTFDCAQATSNGVITISKVEYYYSSNKTATTASFPNATYTLRKGDGIEAPQVSINPAAAASEGTITYSINNESVATIDKTTGELTIVGAGTAKVTAKYSGSNKYEASEASYSLNVYEKSYTTMQELQEAATETSTPVMLTFKDIYVTAVKSSNAYISDGTYGALVYTSGHGLTAGKVINGSALVNLVLYNGQTEITNFPKEGLDIKDATLTPVEADFEVSKENQSALVTIPNAVFADGVLTYDYGTIKYYDNFSTKVALEEGKIYNITGIVVVHNEDIEICPRTASDVEEVASGKIAPNLSASYTENLNVTETDTYTVTYDGDGTIKVESSNTEVATVAISGKDVTVTAVSAGSTTITISAPETDKYEAASLEYTLQVSEEGVETVEWLASTLGSETIQNSEAWETPFNEKIFAYWDAPGKATKPGYNKDGTARLYMGGGYVKISASEGYAITAISMTCSGNNVGYETSANVGTYGTSGSVGSWSGLSPNVTITNNAIKDHNVQMRIKSITVSYVPLTETGNSVTIPSSGKATFTPDADCIIGDGTVSKYITGVEENGYTLVETDAPVVAKDEGVLLSGEAGTYKLYTHDDLSASKNADNHLVGATAKTFAPKDSYILQDKGTGAKFYHVAADNTFDIQGHAYLLGFEAAPEVKVFNFAGDAATAIQEVNEVAETEGAIYNLQGVQVNNSYKGIVIRGGKKFLKK